MKNTGLETTAWVCSLILIGTVWLAGCSKKNTGPVSRSPSLLNTFITVTLYDTQDKKLLDGCVQLCSDYEKLLSKIMEGSEIYRMNHRQPGDRAFTVSEKMVRVLVKGLEHSRISGGVSDITIEPLSFLWDFTAKDPRVPAAKEIQKDLPKVGHQNTPLEGDQVISLNDDTAIDLGAITKGYTADEMKAYPEENGIKNVVISLGGNILYVGGPPGGRPFKVGLQKPYATHTETVAALKVTGMPVVSSGIYERYFIQDGINYRNILGPRTGYPYENGLAQVFIISPRSIDGGRLSTTCFALGLEKGRELIESMEGVYGVFIIWDGGLHYMDGAEDLLYNEWRIQGKAPFPSGSMTSIPLYNSTPLPYNRRRT